MRGKFVAKERAGDEGRAVELAVAILATARRRASRGRCVETRSTTFDR